MNPVEFKLISGQSVFYAKIFGHSKLTTNSAVADFIQVTPKIGLAFEMESEPPFHWVSQSILGMKWIAPLIEKSIKHETEKLVFTISDIQTIRVDFLPEVLTIAIPNWIAQNHHFTLPSWEHTFDRETLNLEFKLEEAE